MDCRRIGRTAAILASAVSGAGATASAYPIAPRTLWDLVREAERVVLARVDAVTHRPGQGDAFGRSVARLRVLETWKGTHSASAEVVFAEGLLCPAPDRYLEREIVLAFLESGDTRLDRITKKTDRRKLADRWSGRWFTVALSYGTLYPGPEDVPVFRELMADALDLQSRSPIPEAERRHWLVQAALHPATRWHGLYELARGADPIHSFYDRRPAPPDLGVTLTGEERTSLADAFCKDPLLDHTVPMMLRLLADYSNPEVDLAALAAVETALAQETVPFWVHAAVPLVLARFGEAPEVRPSRRAKEGKPDCGLTEDPLLRILERTDAETRRAWALARERLGLPSVEPLPVEVRRVRGVGADTPP